MLTIQVNMDQRLAVVYLPPMTVCFLLLLYFGTVWFQKGYDTYANRIGLFWGFLNGCIGMNIYVLYASVGTIYEKYNTVWPVCLDQAGSLYSKEFMDCYGEQVGMTWIMVLLGGIIDLWGAFELYKWALWKLDDPDDETAKKAKDHPTCCAVFPLGNMLVGLFNGFITLSIILTILEGLAIGDGTLIKPFCFPLAGAIIFNVGAYFVLCTKRKNTKQGRMMVFWAWVIVVAVYCRIAYFLAAFIPTQWNLIHLYCTGMEHW